MPSALDGLNRSQRAAVTHPGGPVIVVAGAGTGKTRTLTARFAWLVEQGASPDEILALTFSSQAAAEMRERLEALIEAPYEDLHVATFHAFCSRLLQDEALEAGLDPFFSTVTPADRLALLLDRIHDLTIRHHEIRGNPAPLLASFVSRIDRLKDEMVSAEDYRAHAGRLAERCADGDDAARASSTREVEFGRLYADHDRLLAECGALDFGDLIVRAFRLLHEKPHVRERAARRFRHVLVDEYQDTNFAQGLLLRLLVEEHRNVTVVGDDDQAIYRFRGASQKNLRDFERELGDAIVVRLERNYRSGRRILQAAEAVVKPTPGRIEKRLQGSPGGEVRFWRCRSERAQAQAVAAEAERLVMQQGVPASEVCVLVRSVKNEGPVVGAALEERAVPYRLTGSAAYFQRAEVRDVLAWLRLLADPGDSGAVVRALSRPPIELRSVDVARLTQLARRRQLDMPSAPAPPPQGAPAVRVMTMHAAKGLEFDHVFVLGLSGTRMPGPWRRRGDEVPDELLKESLPEAGGREAHEGEMRRLLHVAMTRARKGLVLAWPESAGQGATPKASPFYEEARAALDAEEEVREEELFDTVARVGGRLGEMRLDTYLDLDQAVARYLELIKVAALIERTREGQPIAEVLPWLNEILAQGATSEQREVLAASALDDWLRDAERDMARRPAAAENGSEPSLDPFIPRRGQGLMLSASDIDTYRLCPLKYKFARVFRIPQEPTIHQRFGIA